MSQHVLLWKENIYPESILYPYFDVKYVRLFSLYHMTLLYRNWGRIKLDYQQFSAQLWYDFCYKKYLSLV